MPIKPDDIGRDVIPARYATSSGREAIDLIRDDMTDLEFAHGHCHGAARAYLLRAGKKEGEDPEKERAKAEWYLDMKSHVLNGTPDPRSSRPDFQPYVRQPSTWVGR